MQVAERMQRLLAADAGMLEQIDAILLGKTDNGRKRVETRLITISEAAKMLGVSRPTIYRFIETGRLDAIEMNGIHRVRLQSVLEFAAGERPANEATQALLARAHAQKKGGL